MSTATRRPHDGWSYNFCGLKLRSSRRISALTSAGQLYLPSEPDLEYFQQDRRFLKEIMKADPRGAWLKEADSGSYRLHIRNAGVVEMTPGNINYAIASERHWQEMQGWLTGLCLGIAAYQLRRIPLHVSGVKIGNRAFLFAGNSGAGKSSMAYGMMLACGGDVICDDMAILAADKSRIEVHPGITSIRLLDSSLRTLGKSSYRPVRDEKGVKKYRMNGISGFEGPTRVAGLVWIGSGERTHSRIDRLTAAQKVDTCIRALYAPKFGHSIVGIDTLMTHVFMLCEQIPMYRLERGPDPSLILSDCRRLMDIIACDS